MKITVAGGGYVGLVSGACLAEIGHDVTIIDTVPQKVEMINNGVPPIYELGLEEILKKYAGKTLRASLNYDSVEDSDIVLISVGTPPCKDGSANLEYIRAASASIGAAIKKARDNGKDKYRVVIVKSTVPPNTTDTLVKPAVLKAAGYETENTTENIGFAMNPEFLREGLAVEDFLNPDRIVIGSDTLRAGELVEKMYEGITQKSEGGIVHTGISAAEMIKYTSNAFLATKITFSNEIGNLCKALSIDIYEVMKGVGLDHRINPYFLNAGAGFGGSCFPKDVAALISLAAQNGEDLKILKSVIETNDIQPLKMIEILKRRLNELGVKTIAGKKIAVLGLAFKDNTDDIRDSRSIPVISKLIKEGAKVYAYDKMAIPNMKQVFSDSEITYCDSPSAALEGADACLVMTEWSEFTKLDHEFNLMKSKIIIEGRRILSIKEKEGICW